MNHNITNTQDSRWEFDKNVCDFIAVAENLRDEGQNSRADVIEYLIKRVIRAENEIKLTKIRLKGK